MEHKGEYWGKEREKKQNRKVDSLGFCIWAIKTYGCLTRGLNPVLQAVLLIKEDPLTTRVLSDRWIVPGKLYKSQLQGTILTDTSQI